MKHNKVLDTYIKDMDYALLQKMQKSRVRENYMIEFKGNEYLNPKNPNKQNQLYDLSKRIAGFANTEGGFIFFGISEKNHVIKDLEGCDHDVSNIIKRVILHLQPVPQVLINPAIPNPIDRTKFFYILEIFKSNRPTMIFTKDHPRKGTFPIRIDEETTVADLKHVEMLFYTLKEERKQEKLIKAFIETLQLAFSARNNVVMQLIFERLKLIARSMKGAPFISFMDREIYILDKFLILPDRILDYSLEPVGDSKKEPSILMKFSSEFREYIKERYNIYMENIFD